jgi:SAM-dependent methyltransferase
MIPIVSEYLSLIKPGMRVLDVGCGSWNLIQKHCENIGAEYEGIDTLTEYFGKKTVATRIENLKNISFPNDYFDAEFLNYPISYSFYWISRELQKHSLSYNAYRILRMFGLVFKLKNQFFT